MKTTILIVFLFGFVVGVLALMVAADFVSGPVYRPAYDGLILPRHD